MKQIKSLLKIFFFLILGHIYYRYKFRNKDVLIYQMGKVGSSTLKSSIKNSIHLHSLDGLSNKYFINNYTERLGFIDFALEKIRWHIIQSNIKKKIKKQKPLKVITLVRDPISRNVSAFFQPIKVQNQEFTQDYFYLNCSHFTPVYWFEYEMKKHLKIDVFQYPFDKEKGYGEIEKDNIKLLVLKLENITENQDTIRRFLNDDRFGLSDSNLGSNKWYAELYSEFKKEFVPTEDYVSLLYNSEFMKHFYTEDEIKQFREKWVTNNILKTKGDNH